MKFTFLDGATGTNLMKAGMPQGVCVEKWVLDNPDVIISLQEKYVEGGSDIVYSSTFGANPIWICPLGDGCVMIHLHKKKSGQPFM